MPDTPDKTNNLSSTDPISEHHIHRGDELRKGGVWEPAIIEFKKAIHLMPKNPSLYLKLGQTYEGKGLQEREDAFIILAMEQYRKAITFNPTFQEAHDRLISLGAKLARLDELVAEYKSRLSREPESEILKTSLKKLQTLSLLAIPQVTGTEQKKGCLGRFFFDMYLPVTGIMLFLIGLMIHNFAEHSKLYPFAKPMILIGLSIYISYILYLVSTHRGAKKRSQW